MCVGPSTIPGVGNSLPSLNVVVVFAPSETRKNISIPLMNDNIALEPVESYVASLEVRDSGIAEVGNPGMTTISVSDDDGE